jgi:hypothetical protein
MANTQVGVRTPDSWLRACHIGVATSSGNVAAWFMTGATIASTAGYGNVGTNWTVQALNAE